MRFQTKVLITYSLLVILIAALLSVLIYSYSSSVFEGNAKVTYQLLCTKLGQQLDNEFKPMDFISTDLISSEAFRSALATLGSTDGQTGDGGFFADEAIKTIRHLLSSYSIYKNFFSVVVFNGKGNFFSSNFIHHTRLKFPSTYMDMLPWTGKAAEAQGRIVTVSPYPDPWSSGGTTKVFSRARIVPGPSFDLGFIEVQNQAQDLGHLLEVPDQKFVHVLVFQPDGSMFYQNETLSPELRNYYRDQAIRQTDSNTFKRNPFTKETEFITSSTSDYSGLKVVVVLSRKMLLAPLGFVRSTILLTSILIILFSIAFTWLSSRQLTRPLKLIKDRMEQTELSNLPNGSPILHSNDEIVALDQAFRSLTGRLDEAIRHELDSRTAWIEARMDSLQAQVNPHFINNILTVIANQGLESGNLKIGEICGAVASMLRYSTSTEERSATLADELNHVRSYLFLMKQRLEERLDYIVEADPQVLDSRVPKIIFQQIVENSINHGYRSLQKPMFITLRAYRSGSRWAVEMTDDGEGFDPRGLESLHEKLETVALGLNSGAECSGIGLGGLGIVNTYSRLFLFYHGDLLWIMENREGGGAWVVIGGPLDPAHKEVRHAAGADCRG